MKATVTAAAAGMIDGRGKLGATFIDTADVFGPEVREQLIAEKLCLYPAELVIATRGGQIRAAHRRRGTGEAALAAGPGSEGSLARLAVERSSEAMVNLCGQETL